MITKRGGRFSRQRGSIWRNEIEIQAFICAILQKDGSSYRGDECGAAGITSGGPASGVGHVLGRSLGDKHH